MTRKVTPLQARAARGDFDLVLPLDLLLLEKLPVEGTTMGGVYEIGSTVREIHKTIPVSVGSIAARLRSMEVQGLTRKVRMVGNNGTTAWQHTKLGKKLLDERKKSG